MAQGSKHFYWRLVRWLCKGFTCQEQYLKCFFTIGVVSTFVGSGVAGLLDGNGIAAKFYNARGLAVDNYGNLFVADANNNAIRKVTPTGK